MSAPTYLSNALDDLCNSLQENLERVQGDVLLGQPPDALQDSTGERCRMFLHLTGGNTERRGVGDCDLNRNYGVIRCYWLLTNYNRELVERSMADMIVQLPFYFNSDVERTLTDTIAKWYLRSAGGVSRPYDIGYENVGGRQHRVLLFHIEIEITL